MKPCADCPFRLRVFTPLPTTARAMVEFVLDSYGVGDTGMYCHESRQTECRGAILFRDDDQSGVVFRTVEALVRAHRRSRRPPQFKRGFEEG
jgi:hypothetical protein